MNILTGFNRSLSGRVQGGAGGEDRPDLKPGASNNPVLGDPALYYDPTVFALPPEGFFGNLGRNTVVGPGVFNVDFSVTKSFALSEQFHLAFRSEFYNLLNHPLFGAPSRSIFTTTGGIQATAGKILTTVGPPRQIQLSLKLTF